MVTSVLAKDSHFHKEQYTNPNSSYPYTITCDFLVQPDINITCLEEYQCFSAKRQDWT